jgi:hypothetical protein
VTLGNVTVNATQNGSVNLTAVINYAPSVTIATIPSATVGTAFTVPATVSDPNIPGPLADVLTISYAFGDGTVLTTPTHTYTTAGTYVVTVTVTDRFGLTANASGSVTVAAAPSSGGGSSGGGGGSGSRRGGGGGGGGLYIPPSRTNTTNTSTEPSVTDSDERPVRPVPIAGPKGVPRNADGSLALDAIDGASEGRSFVDADGTIWYPVRLVDSAVDSVAGITGAAIEEFQGTPFATRIAIMTVLGALAIFGVVAGVAYLLKPRP